MSQERRWADMAHMTPEQVRDYERAEAGIAEQQSWEAAQVWFDERDYDDALADLKRYLPAEAYQAAVQAAYDEWCVGQAEAADERRMEGM